MSLPPQKPPVTGAPPRPLAPKGPAVSTYPDDEVGKEQLQSSELDELTHAEYRLLYEEAAQNVLFAKRQQWRVLEYFTLLSIALAAIGIVMPFAQDVANFVSGFLIFVGTAIIAVLLMLQVWQNREHAKQAYLASDLSNFARTARRLKPKASSDVHRYVILGVMIFYVIVLAMVIVRLLGDIGR